APTYAANKDQAAKASSAGAALDGSSTGRCYTSSDLGPGTTQKDPSPSCNKAAGRVTPRSQSQCSSDASCRRARGTGRRPPAGCPRAKGKIGRSPASPGQPA